MLLVASSGMEDELDAPSRRRPVSGFTSWVCDYGGRGGGIGQDSLILEEAN